ncbi:unnamed protein product [Notodromas monacha]|uniref:Metallo-beta-lactamase domain-containing protein 1 n=1 Tax=Notodromas monacha TaxID=399045 RepID=A0A7R9BT96_9CRUS|nr:unnamed protein product [Notodromas monacha]CAG0920270.1 unnamed protein product [Notodromas monacha]
MSSVGTSRPPPFLRKAVRATLILAPLFGMNFLTTLYRPPEVCDDWSRAYDILKNVVDGTQGFFVALLFCYLNGENEVVDFCWNLCMENLALEKEGVNPSRVTHCVATHGHYDHVGNMNLFQDAKWHIVGFTVFQPRDKCYLHPFECNEPFIVDDWVRILPTPGHTLSDVTVIVDAVEGMGTVAVAGDLFEKEEDVEDPSLWIGAGSENPAKQKENRWKIASMADWIIPGHGPIFKVTEKHRDNLKSQLP